MSQIGTQYKKQTVELKKKALEPQERFCRILKKNVTILLEYVDYKHQGNKGEAGTLYCENIIECYHNNIKCRYSGISPLYPDPFTGEDDGGQLELFS